MRVTVNGMIIEGTPQEITFFMHLNHLQLDEKPASPSVPSDNERLQLLHYHWDKKQFALRKEVKPL